MLELMIATVIFLTVSVVVFTTLASSENNKRTSNSVNDIDQNGAFIMLRLGTLLRSAGSVFAPNYLQAFGCRLIESISGTTKLPLVSPATIPAPFAGIPLTQRVAPVIIYYQQAPDGISDVISIMEGASGFEATRDAFLYAPTTTTAVNLQQSINIAAGDLLLVSQTVPSDCLIEQVSSTFVNGAEQVSLAGNYLNSGGTGTSLSSFPPTGGVMDLGSVSNPPSFVLIGIDANRVLYSYDILQISAAATPAAVPPTPIAEDVLEIHALYYVDTNADGIPDTYESPKSAPYDYASLNLGTTAALDTMTTIKAIRLGVILRTEIAQNQASNVSNTAVQQLTPILFADTPYPVTASTFAANPNYRYRTFEATIPLRNLLFVPSL